MTGEPPRLCLRSAQAEDAARIAEIHMAAFRQNLMLHSQFPTAQVRHDLEKSIENKALADIADAKTTVLVVDNPSSPVSNSRSAIAFAKWSHPVQTDEQYTEPPWDWPEGTNMKVLEAWSNKITDAERRSVGQTPCYRLTFIATDPAYSRMGAGSLLVKWGLRMCETTADPVYLESTVEAVPFYKRLGLTARERIVLQVGDANDVGNKIYEEVSFTYRCFG